MIMLFQLSMLFVLSTARLRIMSLMAMLFVLTLSMHATQAAASEEMDCTSASPTLQRMNSDSSAKSSKSGKSPAQNLLISTQSAEGEALEDNPTQKEISPDSVAASLFCHFDLSSSSSASATPPPIPPHVYGTLFHALQTTVDQHFAAISFEELSTSYPDSVRMLSSFPDDKQSCMARFCLSFAYYAEISDNALAQLMHALRPETLLCQFSDSYDPAMTFPNNADAYRALKNTMRHAPRPVDVGTIYEIYNFAPALFHDGSYIRDKSSLDEKISIIRNFIYPHPHFEMLQRWNRELILLACPKDRLTTISAANSDYLRSIPTVDEYRCMACDFGYLATYATSNINKAMIKNWLVEHKATPTLRHAIVEQTAILMNQPDSHTTKINTALDSHSTNPLDFMLLDPMCQPTDILEALYQTTANRTDLQEDTKIAMQWNVVWHVKAIKTAAKSMSDSEVAVKIKETSDKFSHSL
jgi:hypothetical protein